MSEVRLSRRAGEGKRELKGCPFCGKQPGLADEGHIECDWPGCPARVYVTDVGDDVRSVAERWNTRAGEPEVGMVRVRAADVRALVKGYGYGLLDDGFDVELMGRMRRVLRKEVEDE